MIEKLQAKVNDQDWGHADRKVLVTSGTSGALNLAMWALVDPGDEVIVFDPYFVMYPTLTEMVGGVPVVIDTYHDDPGRAFQIDLAKVEAAITAPHEADPLQQSRRTRPASWRNPRPRLSGLAELAAKHNVALLSDEIYSQFCLRRPPALPRQMDYDRAIVVDGFSKSYGVTGWRIGWVQRPVGGDR